MCLLNSLSIKPENSGIRRTQVVTLSSTIKTQELCSVNRFISLNKGFNKSLVNLLLCYNIKYTYLLLLCCFPIPQFSGSHRMN